MFTMLRSVWSPPQHIYRHLYFWDKFSVKVDSRRSFVMRHHGYELENELFWRGLELGWESESMAIWRQLCAGADVVLDIGANTGLYSLVAKTLLPRAKVYAFEPVPTVFQRLQENCHLNGYDISCRCQAASNFDGTASIYMSPTTDHVYSVTVNQNHVGSTAVQQSVATTRMSTFIAQERLQKIDLIKLDVETHEPEVLEGFGVHLSAMRPTMLIEILSSDIGQRVEALVSELDYLYFNVDERGGIRRTDHIGKSDFYNYVLCAADRLPPLLSAVN